MREVEEVEEVGVLEGDIIVNTNICGSCDFSFAELRRCYFRNEGIMLPTSGFEVACLVKVLVF